MPTLDEILNNNLGLGENTQVKTAQVKQVDEIEKLAMELGLVDNNNNLSASQQEHGHSKEASMTRGLDSLYNDMFPGDGLFGGQEKTAAINKKAAQEERQGELAHEAYEKAVDYHITKIAEALVVADGGTEAHPQQMETKAYEIWRYYGLQGGIEFVFVGLRGGRDMWLVHSTAQNELFDSNWERWLK